MDSNIEGSITKIYEKQQTMSGSEDEAMQFLQVLENHPEVNVNIENNDIPIKLKQKSWNKIIKMIPEEDSYSLSYICFSLVDEVQENEIWGLRKNAEQNEAEVFQDVFFNTVLEASVPHEIPFAMCEEDFSQFTDYFNQKETNDKNIKLSNEEWIKDNLKDKEKEKEETTEAKDDDDNKKLTEVKQQVIEDKDGVKRIVTTKTLTQSQTVYKKKIQPQKDKEKEKLKEIKDTKEKPISIQKEEPQSKMIRKKVIVGKDKDKEKEIKEDMLSQPQEEEVIYRIVKQGRFRPKSKVIKKIKNPKTNKDIENEILNDEIIYETDKNKPNIKIKRKKLTTKNGKEEVIEEEPKNKVIYKIIKFTKDNDTTPQTKIVRISTNIKNGRENKVEEDITGDELVLQTIKQDPNKIIKKIILKRDGKVQEIDEEIPSDEKEGEKMEQPDNLIIRKKVVPKEISQQEIKDDKIIKPTKEEEPQSKGIRRKVFAKESKPEDEVSYKIVKTGRFRNAKTKVIKKIKYGKDNEPQTKIKRIKTITKFGRDRDNEEDLPGDELIIKSTKNGPNQVMNKIIVMKDGKVQEIEEEIPEEKEKENDNKIAKRTVIRQEKEPEEKQDEVTKTIQIGKEKAPQIIHKRIIPKNIPTQEQKEENVVEESPKKLEKEDENQPKVLRRKIISRDIKPKEKEEEIKESKPEDEVSYKIVKTGRFRNAKTKVVKKVNDKEEDKLNKIW